MLRSQLFAWLKRRGFSLVVLCSFASKIPVRMKDILILFTWIMCYVVGSTIPIWGGAILHRYHSKTWPTILSFSENGEFALLASSLLGSLFFVLVKDFNKSRFPGTVIFAPAAFALMAISAIMFSGAMSQSPTVKGDAEFMLTVTTIIYIIALILSIISVLIDINVVPNSLDNLPKAETSALGRRVRSMRKEE